jgi:hypothetical protein
LPVIRVAHAGRERQFCVTDETILSHETGLSHTGASGGKAGRPPAGLEEAGHFINATEKNHNRMMDHLRDRIMQIRSQCAANERQRRSRVAGMPFGRGA